MKNDEDSNLEKSWRRFSYIYVDLKCLVSIDDFFKLIEKEIKKFLNACHEVMNGNNSSGSIENLQETEIKNFRDLFDALYDIERMFEVYLVI
jgi:hypothetical protein